MVSIHEARDEKPCKMNSSPQLLSSVSLPDFKLSPGVTQLGELSAVVTVCQIFCFGPNLLAHITYTHFPLISI